jgi:dienelactone hydrolase
MIRVYHRHVRRVLLRIAAALAVLLLLALGYTGVQAWRSSRPVTLPVLAGPYRLGRSTFEWTDLARTDPLAPRPTFRRLSAWVWYPAQVPASAHDAAYLPGAWSGIHFPFPAGLAETRPSAVRTQVAADAPPAPGRYPLVVLEPGLGFSAPQYSSIAESLAGQGYYVVGVTPTYSSNLTVVNGRAVHASRAGIPKELDQGDLHDPAGDTVADRLTGVWATDAHFAADRAAAEPRLAPHVDRRRTIYLGHSFGGSAALEACRTDADCTAAVDLDGTQYGAVARTGLTKPVMIVQSGGSCVTGTCTTGDRDPGDVRVARRLLSASPGRHRCLAADRARHFSFSDYGAYHLALPLRHLLALGPAPGRAVLRQTAAEITAFLQDRSAGSSLLTAVAC